MPCSTTEQDGILTRREPMMGWVDKLRNKKDEGQGTAKEHLGKATGDEQMESEGKTDQSVSNVKQAGEKVKDAFEKD